MTSLLADGQLEKVLITIVFLAAMYILLKVLSLRSGDL